MLSTHLRNLYHQVATQWLILAEKEALLERVSGRGRISISEM